MDYRVDEMIKKITNSGKIFDYEISPHRFKAVYQNILYATVGEVIKLSKNYGIDWENIESSNKNFKTMVITRNLTVFGFTVKPTKVFKSTDLINFSECDLSEFGDIDTVNWYNVDTNGDVVIFAEKNILKQDSINGTRVARVFRTTDNGVTWTTNFEHKTGDSAPDEIGHWHSLDYLGGANQYGIPEMWLLTSGDHNDCVKWFMSKDNGLTWEQLVGIKGQKYRTLKVNRHAEDRLIWATDALPSTFGGIYKSEDMDDILGTTKLITPLPLTSYGAIVRGKGICMTEREGNFAQDGVVYIYATKDCGETWQLEKEVSIRDVPVGHHQPGFHEIFGPDGKGNYYMNGSALKNCSALIARTKKEDLI